MDGDRVRRWFMTVVVLTVAVVVWFRVRIRYED